MDAHASVFLSFFHIENWHIPSFWLAITAGTWAIGITVTALTRHWVPAQNFQFAGFIWPKAYQLALWIGRKTHVFDARVLDRFVVKLTEAQVIIAHLSAWIDRHLVDGLVGGIASFSLALGARARTWQSAQVQKYWIWVFITLIFILLYLLY